MAPTSAGIEISQNDCAVVSAKPACAGPRRLTLVVEGLPKAQPDVQEERKGPQKAGEFVDFEEVK